MHQNEMNEGTAGMNGGIEGRKRDLENVEGGPEADLNCHPRKKGKNMGELVATIESEVGETSRVWSQNYK